MHDHVLTWWCVPLPGVLRPGREVGRALPGLPGLEQPRRGAASGRPGPGPSRGPPRRSGHVPSATSPPCEGAAVPTGLAELDRVLSGGLVSGSVTLLGGEPGIGKSTLLLQVVRRRWPPGAPARSTSPPRSRPPRSGPGADRLGAVADGLWVVATAEVEAIVEHLADRPWDLLVVDSVQAVRVGDRSSPPGSVVQVRDCAHRLAEAARSAGRGDDPRRPRHQGRVARRAPPARAPRRHRPLLRGRPPPRGAPAPSASSTASAPRRSSGCSR